MTSKIDARDEIAKIHLTSLYGKFLMTTTAFKRKKAITLPTFKFIVDVPLFVKILEPMHEGAVRLGRGKVADPDKKPPTLARVINLETGEEGQVILASVLKTELDEAYPNGTYVGLGFEMCKQKRKEGKQYDPYSLAEIELPAEQAAPAVKEAAAAPAADVGKKK